MEFECDRCGICCQHIDMIPQLKMFDAGNGRCIHLTNENLCEIYADRPIVCNVEKMFDLYFKDKISKEDYILLNKEGCIKIKRHHQDLC